MVVNPKGKKKTKGGKKMARTRRKSNAWFDDSKGHAKAAKKAWSTRKKRYPPSGYRASKRRSTRRKPTRVSTRRKSTRRKSRKNSWYDDSRRHSAAARKGWKTRRNSWYDDSSGHSAAARKGWKTRRNPTYANPVNVSLAGVWGFTRDTFTIPTVIGGVVGAVTTIAVPKMFKLNDGSWKEILSSVAVVGVGGYAISEFVDEQAGYAFAITGAAVVGMKLLRIGLSKTAWGKKASSYLSGTQEDLVEGSVDEFMGLSDFDIEDTSDEYELFGVGEDSSDEALDELFGEDDGALVPTFSGVA